MKFLNRDIEGAKAEATFNCVNRIQSDVQGVADDIDEVKQQIEVVKEMIVEVNRLLNTPQGRRPDIPLNPEK